ncbi:MAG: DHH family phosphoesterase [archaeon]
MKFGDKLPSWEPGGFQEKLAETAEKLSSLENPKIFCHIDADGLTSGSIIFYTIEKMGKTPQIFPIRQLDAETILLVPKEEAFVLVDFGSGQKNLLSDPKGPGVIIDHHEPIEGGLSGKISHLNAAEQGFSGSAEISASGLAYLVSERLIGETSLIPLAITGAVGDIQAKRGLTGLNREILKKGIAAKEVVATKGLPFFGRETRELAVFLSYATDPFLPGLSGSIAGCSEFLRKLGINPLGTYNRLPSEELARLVTGIHERAIAVGLEPWQISNLVTETYTFPKEMELTEPRDATEFSTLLNSCGRNEWANVGIKICLGDRGDAYLKAKELLAEHRENIKNGLQELEAKPVRLFGKNIQIFQSEKVKPTIIGIVIGIALGGRLVDPSRVFIGTAAQDPGNIKVSARTTAQLVRRGANLSEAIRTAAKEVGGLGGGHNIAAGATIPKSKLEEFAKKFDGEISKQLDREQPKKLFSP